LAAVGPPELVMDVGSGAAAAVVAFFHGVSW